MTRGINQIPELLLYYLITYKKSNKQYHSRSVKCVKAQMLQRSKFLLPARQLGKH